LPSLTPSPRSTTSGWRGTYSPCEIRSAPRCLEGRRQRSIEIGRSTVFHRIRRVRRFVLDGGNLAHPTRFERVTSTFRRRRLQVRIVSGAQVSFRIGASCSSARLSGSSTVRTESYVSEVGGSSQGGATAFPTLDQLALPSSIIRLTQYASN